MSALQPAFDGLAHVGEKVPTVGNLYGPGSTEAGATGDGAKAGALASRSLREDQRAAFDHATAAGGLRIVEGRAGTGKSYTLAAVREAHERAGPIGRPRPARRATG